MLNNKKMDCACGGIAKEHFTNFKGFKVRGWKCGSCNEEFLDPRYVNPILKLNKLLRENRLKSTIGVVGNSFTIRIPKPLAEAYHLTKGKEVSYVLEKEGFGVKVA